MERMGDGQAGLRRVFVERGTPMERVSDGRAQLREGGRDCMVVCV